MMNHDISTELARLLIYIGNVATAIRLNSQYNGKYDQLDKTEVGRNVLWLSDSLHCLSDLGYAIHSCDNDKIVDSCNGLITYYEMFITGDIEGRYSNCGDPNATLQNYSTLFDPRDAVILFKEIKTKAL